MFNKEYRDPQSALKSIRVIFFAILAGPLIFLAVILSIASDLTTAPFEMYEPLNLGLIILALSAFPLSSFVSRKIFAGVREEDNISKRLSVYQAGLIIRLGMYEAVEFYSIVVCFITGNLTVLLFALVALIGIVINYPSAYRIKDAVGIAPEEVFN